MAHGAEHVYAVGNEGREVFWNAPYELILFAFTAVALAIFAYGLYRRWQMWTAIGLPENRNDSVGERVKLLLLKEISHSPLDKL